MKFRADIDALRLHWRRSNVRRQPISTWSSWRATGLPLIRHSNFVLRRTVDALAGKHHLIGHLLSAKVRRSLLNYCALESVLYWSSKAHFCHSMWVSWL
jgi:hypothetical protein